METIISKQGMVGAEVSPTPPEVRAPTQGQLNLVRALPDNDKIVWEPTTRTVKVDACFTEANHQAELARIFNRLPLPSVPAALLPERGSYACRTIYGKEVIFSRDRDGKVHAMLNVCKHRGSRIVTDQKTHKGGLLSCPFHAWSYDLTGRLIAVPRENTFQPLNKPNFGLSQLRCKELGGIIWLKLDPQADDDFSTVPSALTEDLEALGVPTMHLFASNQHSVAANWKLVMDTFQEGYHVVRLHAESLKGRFEDALELVDRLGLHMRRAAGRIGYRRTMLEGHAHSLADLRKLVTFHYTLFPHSVLICSQYYVTLLVFVPTGVATCEVFNFMLTDHPPGSEKELDRFNRSHDMTDRVTFPEDFAAASDCQVGISSGAIKEFTLCPLERYVAEFHQIVDDVVSGREPTVT